MAGGGSRRGSSLADTRGTENAVEEDWDRAFNINVKSHLWLMHAAKEHLDATAGAFITTASTAGMSHSGSSLVRPSPGLRAATLPLSDNFAGILGNQSRADSPCQRLGTHGCTQDSGEQRQPGAPPDGGLALAQLR